MAASTALYIDKGSLDFEYGNYTSALDYYKKAQFYNNKSPDVDNLQNLLKGIANSYSALKDYKNAVRYFNMFKAAKDSYDSTFYRTRYMTMYAEYNYNNYIAQITSDKKLQRMLVIIILIISLSLITITFYLIRLKRSKQRHVEKSIELATTEPFKVTLLETGLDKHRSTIHEENLKNDEYKEEHKQKYGDNSNNEYGVSLPAGSSVQIVGKEIDGEIIRSIIAKLEYVVTEEKVFLDPDLTITGLAEKLGTNRTYLSKAIIQEYKMNFISCINELRIKEAIRFISYGEHYNLNMDGIAQKAGFNNRVSFTKTFQKYTGVSPSFFIKNAAPGIITKD